MPKAGVTAHVPCGVESLRRSVWGGECPGSSGSIGTGQGCTKPSLWAALLSRASAAPAGPVLCWDWSPHSSHTSTDPGWSTSDVGTCWCPAGPTPGWLWLLLVLWNGTADAFCEDWLVWQVRIIQGTFLYCSTSYFDEGTPLEYNGFPFAIYLPCLLFGLLEMTKTFAAAEEAKTQWS